jgi:membrane protein
MWRRLNRHPKAVVATVIDVLRGAARAFHRHRVPRLSAGLAYYSLFAFIPTVFLATVIAAAFFGEEATEGRLVDRLDDVVGLTSAERIEEAVAALWENTDASAFAFISVGLAVYSASILFVAWRDALDVIWDVPYRSGLETSIRSRAFGALVPISVGILLAAILLVEMVTALVAELITSPLIDALIRLTETIFPTVASTFALALLYRHTTRLRPQWGDVWPGTLVAALALAVLTWGYGIYLRIYGSSSVVGAAGSLVLGVALIYYSAQVLLYGAEVIRVCADHRGRPISPTSEKAGDQ